ncbi:ParB N-terminal domain-containing protein [Duganella sp. FT109W]|uniref:ParB N-terminal domain-containing protein n=1 Tax=Duganella margarita TaxID=2692170 RepID=A0ABW9WHD6_9BURK|nr:ParB/Srx family N-terminal domain-containing protein [Duganella margarita]MYN39784.1 ParB N-terminal domain-containing protein [Duganella margarita]
MEAGSYVQSVIRKEESRQLSSSLASLVSEGETLDPLIVWKDPVGQLWVIDGHHRMEALQEADTPPEALVWTQEYLGQDEASARRFALDLNRRLHLNMHPKEALEAYWLMLLAGEVSGSLRDRAKRFQISKSTIARMDKQKPAVLATIEQQATSMGAAMDVEFIRDNAPTWKGLEEWSTGHEQSDKEELEQKAVEKVTRSLAIRYASEAKAQPEVLLQAFTIFFEGVTGEQINIQRGSSDQSDAEF